MQALEGRGTEMSTKTSSLWVVFMETIMHNLVSHNKDGSGIMNGNPSHNNVTEEGLLPFLCTKRRSACFTLPSPFTLARGRPINMAPFARTER